MQIEKKKRLRMMGMMNIKEKEKKKMCRRFNKWAYNYCKNHF
jgi:hypothetical protein